MVIKKTTNWFKTSKATTLFATVAFAAGLAFVGYSNTITGNIILTDKQSFNALSLIGLGLLFCSVVLALYSLKHRK